MTPKVALNALLLCLAYALPIWAQSTTVVSLTSTTTVHATASDYGAACNNFRGSCVVYGDGDVEGGSYTTTINPETSPTPTSLVTSTTVVPATTTVSDADYCSGFEGSCVVYAGNGGEAAYTTTAAGYQAGQGTGQQALGNSDGYIAMDGGGHAGAIGSGATLSVWKWGATAMCASAVMLLLMA